MESGISPFELLRNNDIITILDGDTQFADYEFEDGVSIKIAMPYLSGPAICSISQQFGLPQRYNAGRMSLSRKQYFDNLINHCIKQNRCSDLLAYLFSKDRFTNVFTGRGAKEIDSAYRTIIDTIIDKINGILSFGKNELILQGSTFFIRQTNAQVEIAAPQIHNIDREYIKSLSERALQNIEEGHFDSAITQSRTLLEEVFCYAIEKKGQEPSDSGNIGRLYGQVKDLYSMHGHADTDRRINTLLSGLEKIVSSITEMRNDESDAHGVGQRRINIEAHHARLLVNAATTMGDFILAVVVKANT